MNYQEGYKTLFDGLTNLSQLIKTLDEGDVVNMINCIRVLQEKGEQACRSENQHSV